MKTAFLAALVWYVHIYGLLAQTHFEHEKPSAWTLFAQTKFTSKYYKDVDMYLLAPSFSLSTRQMEGKQVELSGYYIPFDTEEGGAVILSKYPYSQCFFCGGAGPESVAEVFFKSDIKRLRPDEFITVLGTLRLNADDINHVNFLIENAELIIGNGK